MYSYCTGIQEIPHGLPAAPELPPPLPTRPGLADGTDTIRPATLRGLSPDQTLSWTSTVHPDQSRRLVIRLWDGKTMATVIDDKVAAPPK